MANLKLDLINKINNDKYYAESELVRLAQTPNMNYKIKIHDMDKILKEIAIYNAKLGLIEQYFTEPNQQNPPVQGQAAPVPPQGKVHPGQSHGE